MHNWLQLKMQQYIDRFQVYLALEDKLIQPDDVIQALPDCPTENDLVAYQHFVVWCQEEEYPLGLDTFFDSHSEEYLFLHLAIDQCSHVTIKKDLAAVTTKFFFDPSFHLLINGLSGRYNHRVGSCNERRWALIGRWYQSISPDDLTLPDVQTLLLQTNATGVLKESLTETVSDSFLESLIQHCNEMQRDLPALWSLLRIEYVHLVQTLHQKNLLTYHPRLHSQLVDLFDELFSIETKGFSELAWKIYYLSVDQAAYYLGFPLWLTEPKWEDLIPALQKLSQVGIDEYCVEYRKQNKKLMENRILFGADFTLFGPCLQSARFINDTDTLHEDIFMYSSLDLFIIFDQDKRFFLLSIIELPDLIERGVNPWTNRPLPKNMLSRLQDNLNKRLPYRLPYPPEPIPDLLKSIEEETSVD